MELTSLLISKNPVNNQKRFDRFKREEVRTKGLPIEAPCVWQRVTVNYYLFTQWRRNTAAGRIVKGDGMCDDATREVCVALIM